MQQTVRGKKFHQQYKFQIQKENMGRSSQLIIPILGSNILHLDNFKLPEARTSLPLKVPIVYIVPGIKLVIFPFRMYAWY